MSRRPLIARLPDAWPVGALLAVATALRAHGIGRDELWPDEAYAALLSDASVSGIVRELTVDSSPPLYYLALHGWRSMVGGEAAALRWLSLLCGVATVYVLYRLGARLLSVRTGLAAAALLAVSPLHVHYSQEARPYALLALWALIAIAGLSRAASDSRSPWGWPVYVVGTVLALYTHNYGIFLLALPLAGLVSRRLTLSHTAVATTAIAIAYLPWLPQLTTQLQGGAAQWLARLWRETEAPLVRTAAVYAIGGPPPPYVLSPRLPGPPWLAALAAIGGAGLALRGLVATPRRAWPVVWALASVVLLPYAVSFFRPVYLAGRYDLLGLPLYCLLCAAGLEALPAAARRGAAITLITVAAVVHAGGSTRAPLIGVQAQARTIAAASGAGDRVLALGLARTPLEYYTHAHAADVAFHSFPSSTADHRGWVDERLLADPAALRRDAEDVIARLSGDSGAGRVWLAHSRTLGDADRWLLESLFRRYAPTPCPQAAERLGLSCWLPREPRQPFVAER